VRLSKEDEFEASGIARREPEVAATARRAFAELENLARSGLDELLLTADRGHLRHI
jgi:hypothetical protein